MTGPHSADAGALPELASRTKADDIPSLRYDLLHHVRYSLAREWEEASERDLFHALALVVRDRLVEGMLDTEARYQQIDPKRLYYLSMEFLMGRALGNNLSNLGILDLCRQVLAERGLLLEAVEESEPDAALGNGGLGRLAACFLDSLATLGMPGYGYGINYEYGLFQQQIDNGYQRERPDNWLAYGTPWTIERPDQACLVPIYGRIEHAVDRHGGYNPMWLDWKFIVGVPHDMPIVGYGGKTVHYLRLYSARASNEFDMSIFNEGDYIRAVEMKIQSETISKVLYPSDSVAAGRELRLVQEYFLVACTVRDIIRRYLQDHQGFDSFPSKVAIQLNDTHPALTVVELMRTLVDEYDTPWEQAWEITQATLGYTNHTLMGEALERWPVPLLEQVLPRHLQLIYEINRRFLEQVATRWPNDTAKQQRMSLIEESRPKQIRMANLSIVGSHSVNGVSELHSELVKSSLVPDFYEMWPERFNNKTNGVTPRRWLLGANPELAALISRTIGEEWLTNTDLLRALEHHAEDAGFQAEYARVKRANKERLARFITQTTRVRVDPGTLFDVQIKRIHEYKRQLLHVMYIIHEYLSMVEDGRAPVAPRTHIFAGKAAPGYWAAKQIIKLITSVGEVVNNDVRVKGLIKVVFVPDYRVTVAERIVPAADLSEQISTAGTEASGTGNMKLAMNGALTMGTLDGANIEILDEVGPENIFIFGLRSPEIQQMRERGSYNPWDTYHECPDLKRVMDTFNSNLFCAKEPGMFGWIYQSLMYHGDFYCHVADFPLYVKAQDRAGLEFMHGTGWLHKSILNVARVGKFSSDRTIREYARDIWGLQSI